MKTGHNFIASSLPFVIIRTVTSSSFDNAGQIIKFRKFFLIWTVQMSSDEFLSLFYSKSIRNECYDPSEKDYGLLHNWSRFQIIVFW